MESIVTLLLFTNFQSEKSAKPTDDMINELLFHQSNVSRKKMNDF